MYQNFNLVNYLKNKSIFSRKKGSIEYILVGTNMFNVGSVYTNGVNMFFGVFPRSFKISKNIVLKKDFKSNVFYKKFFSIALNKMILQSFISVTSRVVLFNRFNIVGVLSSVEFLQHRRRFLLIYNVYNRKKLFIKYKLKRFFGHNYVFFF